MSARTAAVHRPAPPRARKRGVQPLAAGRGHPRTAQHAALRRSRPPAARPPNSAVSAAIKLSSPATREFWEIPVLFEDAHLLALDKPAGLLTSPDRHDLDRPSLMKLLHAGIADKKPWARERNLTYLSNAHRLDSETSGVMLLAKNKPALVALADLFGSEKPLQKYVALAWGSPPAETFRGGRQTRAASGANRRDARESAETARNRRRNLRCWKDFPTGRCCAARR